MKPRSPASTDMSAEAGATLVKPFLKSLIARSISTWTGASPRPLTEISGSGPRHARECALSHVDPPRYQRSHVAPLHRPAHSLGRRPDPETASDRPAGREMAAGRGPAYRPGL